jgi:hypothetical protein
VKAAIDRRATGSVLSPAFAVKVNQWSMSQDAWAVADSLEGLTPRHTADAPVNLEIFQKLDSAAGGIKFGQMVQVTAEATAETEQDARALADVLRMLAQLALVRNNDADAALILRGLNVTADARTVKLAVSVPEEQVERIFRPGRRPARVNPAVLRERQ